MSSRNEGVPGERICLIGGGRLGAALGCQLHRVGLDLLAVVEKNPQRRFQLKHWLPDVPMPAHLSPGLLQQASLVILAVQDDGIEPLADQLALQPIGWTGKLVWHCSGALPSAVLKPLAGRGAWTLSVHPILAFSETSPQDVSFREVYFDVEGDPRGLERTHRLLALMGAHLWPVDAKQKPALHLAAVLLSNHLVTLAHLARQVLQGTGTPDALTWKPFRPLIQQTLNNLDEHPPAQALTGPLARGDLKALSSHLSWLQTHLPELLPVYLMLNRAALNFAPLDEAKKQAVRSLLASVAPDPSQQSHSS